MQFFVDDQISALVAGNLSFATEQSIDFTMVRNPLNPDTYVEYSDNKKRKHCFITNSSQNFDHT